MTTKIEWRFATNNARCPYCEDVGRIVQSVNAGVDSTLYTYSCNCRGKQEYYTFTVVKKRGIPPYIRFKLPKD